MLKIFKSHVYALLRANNMPVLGSCEFEWLIFKATRSLDYQPVLVFTGME